MNRPMCSALGPSKRILFEMVMHEYVDVHRQGIKPQVPQQCRQEVFDLIEACLQVDPKNRVTSKDVSEVLLLLMSQA